MLDGGGEAGTAILALQDRLVGAERDQRNPEDMEERPRRARLELRVLAATWALLHPTARPVVVAYDLAHAEEDNHIVKYKT
jgi:hypothetical protein